MQGILTLALLATVCGIQASPSSDAYFEERGAALLDYVMGADDYQAKNKLDSKGNNGCKKFQKYKEDKMNEYFTDAGNAEINRITTACHKEEQERHAKLGSTNRTEAEEQKDRCLHNACIFRGLGILDDQHVFHKEKIDGKVAEIVNKEQRDLMTKIANQCFDIAHLEGKGDDEKDCKKVTSFMSCMFKKMFPFNEDDDKEKKTQNV